MIQSVVRLSEDLKRDTGNFSLPSWAEQYLLPNEEHEKKVLIDIEFSLAELLTKISEQKEVLATMNEFKLLVTGTGRALEVQVARVFENLGFTVAEGLPGRGDLILEYQGTPVVVEVKSSAKSAAEKHAAQLEKWVSEYYAEKGANPKAILIVNAYKDTPLVERTEVSFPSQMLSYSTCRGHCLMTTTQLLGLYLDCLQNQERKAELIAAMLATEGVYPEYSDWQKYLFYQEITEGVTTR